MTESEELREVVLMDVPLALLARSQERQEGLFRELALVRDAGGSGSAPARREHLQAASREGLRHTTVTYRVPASSADLAAEFLDVLREVDGHCRRGQLLTMPPDPQMAALHDWFLGEFIAQLRDAPPTPWPG